MNAPPTTGSRIHWDGLDWQVLAQTAEEVSLRSVDGAQLRTVSLPDLIVAADYVPLPATSDRRLAGVDVLETLPREAAVRATFLQRHVHEVLHGLPPDSPADLRPKPDYGPDRDLRDRVAAKSRELEALGMPLSPRSLWRYVTRYREQGLIGLVDVRILRGGRPTGRSSSELIQLADEVLSSQRSVSTGTRSRAIEQITAKAEARGLDVSSRSTLYRLVANLERQRHPFGNATTRRTQANRPHRAYGHQLPTRPGELVEIDSTPLDVMVLYPDGGTGRVDLTVALDVATRTLCAAILRPVATKAVDAALMLARALTPLSSQPGWAESVAFSRALLPAGMISDPDILERDAQARPLITFESVTIDRGRVFVSNTFLNACERLQISLVKAAPKTPTDKPHVERVFASINSLFTQYLPGYTGHNVVQRGPDPAPEQVWPLAQVQDLLDQWIVQCWQNRPHSGLRLPAMPRQDLSPNEMHAALSSVAPSIPLVLDTADYLELLPRAWRSVQRYGVNLHGLTFDSPALDPFRNRTSGLRLGEARNRWEIRYDPYRINRIFLRDHRSNNWIEAAWTLEAQTMAPFSLDVLHAARRALACRVPRGSYTAAGLVEEIKRIQTSTSAEPRERSARRRGTDSSLAPLALPRQPTGPTDTPLYLVLDADDPKSDPPAEGEPRPEPVRKLKRFLYDEPSDDGW